MILSHAFDQPPYCAVLYSQCRPALSYTSKNYITQIYCDCVKICVLIFKVISGRKSVISGIVQLIVYIILNKLNQTLFYNLNV